MLQLLESACESLEKSRTFCHKPRLAALMASGGSCLWGVEPRGARSHCVLGLGLPDGRDPGRLRQARVTAWAFPLRGLWRGPESSPRSTVACVDWGGVRASASRVAGMSEANYVTYLLPFPEVEESCGVVRGRF